jgi:sialate O-acetylesterase
MKSHPQIHRIAGLRPLICALALVAAFGSEIARADIKLPQVFGSHMVLQQEKPIIIWGWASPSETVKVQLGETTQSTQANERGEWKISLPAMKAAGPLTLTISGSSTVTFDDVMIGEVWLCSGQSNMEMGLGMVNDATNEIAHANHPGIRLLMVDNHWDGMPQNDIKGTWKVCSPETVAQGGWNGFSATAYFFGRELNEKLGVTVGLIDADWGGTRIESWTPPEGFAAVPALKSDFEKVQLSDVRSALHREKLAQTLDEFEKWNQVARKAMDANELVPTVPGYPDELRAPHDLQQATALFNGMIHPLVPFGIRGAIWYQGESNLTEGMHYADRMRALIGGWREIWNEGDFPFYFVQIAPFTYGEGPLREPELWEAQTVAANTIPNTGMAVTMDAHSVGDIHPKDKQSVGHRLALQALAKTYGKTDLVFSGPTFKRLNVDGEKLRVTFDNVGGGLKSRDGQPLNWFEVIDADEGGFVKADAQIDGDSLVLTSPSAKHPLAMRFAWSGLAEPNLMNTEGLPAGSFRAGDVPKRDWVTMNVPESKDYELVYDLDLTKLGANIQYDADHHLNITKPIGRIAYFVQLQDANMNSQDIYVSMDAFTDDAGKIGVPAFGTGATFQTNVANLNVFSDVKGIVTGTHLAGGNIEFWPNNYAPPNASNVPNASNDSFDFGDQMAFPPDGYGCMQVHNHDARQTLFAINHWREGSKADIGIGNQPKDNPDWTFAANAGNYHAMRLKVYVKTR